jgi:predicted metalloprotease
VMTIVAHEFGHILQMKRGFISQIRNGIPLKSEINADFLSGYFLGTRKLRNSNIRFEKAGELLVRMGRANEGNPTRTHGNSRERLDAAEAGFRVAYLERKSIDEAVAASLEYVQS